MKLLLFLLNKQAVFDGINEAVTKINWRIDHKIPSLRYIFHVCDQPPHVF